MKKVLLFFTVMTAFLQAKGQQYLSRIYGTQDGLPHANVYRIVQDKRGFLWFSTDYGLAFYNGQSFISPTDKEGVLNTSILSVYEDETGLKYVTTHKNGIYLLTDSSLKPYPIKYIDKPDHMLFAVPKGKIIWVVGNGIFKIENHEMRRVALKKNGRNVTFHSLVSYKDELLFAGNDGLYRVKDNGFERFLHDLIQDTTVDIARAQNGDYWVGCRHKVMVVRGNKIVQEYKLKESQIVKDILPDSRNNVWVALDGEGVLLIHNGIIEDISNSLVLNKTIVNDMMEDHEGNIWIATYGGGVFKINSLGVMNYPFEANNTSIYCRALTPYTDSGKVLTGSIGKVSTWEKGAIKQLPFNLLKIDQYVYCLMYIDDRIFAGSSGGLLVKNMKAPYKEERVPCDSAYGAISIYRDRKGRIWVGDYSRLLYLENGKLSIAAPGNELYEGRRYNAIYEDATGNMWYGTDKGVIEHKVDGTDLLLHEELQVNDISQDEYGRIWLAGNNGLAYIENGKYTLLKKENGLSSNKCNKIVTDHNKQLWIGTLAGLDYLDLATMTINQYSRGIYTDEVLSLYCNDTRLFVGTVNKLISVNTNEVQTKSGIPPVYITYIKTSKSQINMPQSVSLPYNDNKLSIGFIGISYQNANAIEYRYKIEGLNDNWYSTNSTSIELPSLPSGDYKFVLNARKNKGAWSKDVVLPIIVATPFWTTWWFIGLVILGTGAMLYMIIRQQTVAQEAKRRQQLILFNKIAYLRQQALSALINPHFIFNCMNSIQYYLDSHENDKANAYLADFAQLIRMTMEDAQKVFISLSNELSRIKLYLSLEQLRFDELGYEIIVNTELDAHNIRIPNMILQPYVENAIWHGIMPKNGYGKIDIRFEPHKENELKITITDNGVGISQSKEQKNKTDENHYGMRLTEERLKLLNQLSNEYYSVRIEEQKTEDMQSSGTMVEIIVPCYPRDISLKEFEQELMS